MIKNNQFLTLILFCIVIKQITSAQKYAEIQQSFKPQFQKEGENADVMRIIGSQQLRRQDPFIMLDFFKVRLPSGFPDHPHRGFETVTYMLGGSIYHEDFRGNKGILEKGDVQWMTAGKGIVHSEMPGSYDEDSIGFQLWINLKSEDKMMEPQYQEHKSEKFPIWKNDDLSVKIISGEYKEVYYLQNVYKFYLILKGIIKTKVSVKFLDVHLNNKKAIYYDTIKQKHSCLLFIYEGKVKINEVVYNDKTVIIFQQIHTQDALIQVQSENDQSKLIILCGEPINEPVFNYGPFVLDSQIRLQQAFQDFQQSKNGFEDANNWKSEIRNFPQTKKRIERLDLLDL